jgi:hypothetical protein
MEETTAKRRLWTPDCGHAMTKKETEAMNRKMREEGREARRKALPMSYEEKLAQTNRNLGITGPAKIKPSD